MKEIEISKDMIEVPSNGLVGALLILGKNFGAGSNNSYNKNPKLDQKRRISVLGAGLLHGIGVSNKIILSSGSSSDTNTPSQARLMKNHLKKIFPHIHENTIILEELNNQDKDSTNDIKKFLRKHPIRDLGLISIGFHMPQSKRDLFRKAGLYVEPIHSNEILANKFPDFVSDYKKSPRFLAEIGKEVLAKFIQTHKMLESIFVSKISQVKT